MRKNRLKKVIASITVVSIVFSCLFLNWEYGGLTAKASGWFLYVGGIDNTKSVSIEDTCSSYPGWSYNAANNTLTLNGYSGIANNSVNAGASGKSANIVYIGTSPLTIELVGSNRISDSTNMNGYYGIYSEQPVTITGSGSLDVNVGNAVDDAGIFVPGSKLTIESGNVTVKSNGYAIGAHGLHVKGGTVDLTGGTCGFSDWNGGGLTISGGSLKATGNGTTEANYAGICSYEGVKIEGGSLNAYGKQYGIFCDNANTDIKSGIVEITGDKQAYTGFPITTSLAGMGWTNAQGTGAGTAIAAGTTLTSFPYLKMKFPVTAAADGSSEGTPASEGTELKDKSGAETGFTVTNSDSSNPTAAYTGTSADAKKTKITIPDTVKDASGNVYKVTEVKPKALKGNTKVKTLIIGKYVTKIGANACDGCTHLSKITVNGNVLKSAGKNWLRKTKSGIKIIVKAKNEKTAKRVFNKIKKKSGAKKPVFKYKKYNGK
jgi:hypothetical protein